MSHPPILPEPGPDYARWIMFGLTLALVAGTVGWFWRQDYLTERCARLGVAFLIENPPPRPSEADWYREHCWEGRPRP